MKIRVIRPMVIDRQARKPGDEVTVQENLGRYLVAIRKAAVVIPEKDADKAPAARQTATAAKPATAEGKPA